MPNIDLEGIRFQSFGYEDPIPEETLSGLYLVHADAFSKALAGSRSEEEIGAYVGNSFRFARKVREPQLLAGDTHFPDQEYKLPVLIVAYDGIKPVGFVRTADNVSGASEQIRRRKELTRWKNYRASIELAVKPSHQHRGIALALTFGAFMTAKHLQRGTAYTFPDELPKADVMVRRLGGIPTGSPVAVDTYFGEDNRPVMQQRYVFTTSRRMGRRMLAHIPGFRWAIEPHRENLSQGFWLKAAAVFERDEFKDMNPHTGEHF